MPYFIRFSSNHISKFFQNEFCRSNQSAYISSYRFMIYLDEEAQKEYLERFDSRVKLTHYEGELNFAITVWMWMRIEWIELSSREILLLSSCCYCRDYTGRIIWATRLPQGIGWIYFNAADHTIIAYGDPRQTAPYKRSTSIHRNHGRRFRKCTGDQRKLRICH